MQIKGLGGALVPVFLFACGGSGGNSGSGGSGGTGTGSGPLLSVTVTSGGTVTSADGSINCTSSCSQTEAAGAQVQLIATPAAGMQFTGWSGACSGTGSCNLTLLNGDVSVGAAFAAQALVTVEVEVDGAGAGTVVSSPAGISCPGTCLMQAAPGTVVALTGTADTGSHFDGYGGNTCHGTTCNFTVSAAAKIFATFTIATAPPADSCAGLMPALPDPMTAAGGVAGPGMECGAATSDGNGIVYISAFADGANNITDVNPNNVQDSHVIDSVQNRGLNATGGSILLSITCTGTAGTFIFQRFDDANHVTSQSSVSDACPATGNGFFFPMVDLMNNTLVVNPLGVATAEVPAGHLAARWFDASGNPLTGWFDAGAIDQTGPGTVIVRPLIGGGAALRSGDNWVATLPSGKATSAAAPAFFEKDKDAVIALGGKAYAMIPDPVIGGSLDIFAASDGKSCGTLASTRVNPLKGQNLTEFYVGKDGTLINTGGPNNCSATYYPHLLK